MIVLLLIIATHKYIYLCHLNSHIFLNIFIFSFLKSRANISSSCYVCVICITDSRPTHLLFTYLLPLSFSTYLFLFSLSSFSSFNSSTPLCHSDQSFALLHFRNSFFCRSFSLMGTFLENRILSLRKLGLVNVVYGDRHNMVWRSKKNAPGKMVEEVFFGCEY